MDSLQLSELQTFFSNNKGELASYASKKFYVESLDFSPLDILDPMLERALDLSEYICQDYFDHHRSNISTQISSDYPEHQSLPQVVLDATAVVHEGKYLGEGSVLPRTEVNFLEPGHSPGSSDGSSYYSDDSQSTTQPMPEFSQLTSPGAEGPSTSFQWPSCSTAVNRDNFPLRTNTSGYSLKHEEFSGFDTEDFGVPTSLAHMAPQPQCSTSEVSSFPFVTSPSTSLPSPSSTIYSVSSPGTPGPSGPSRGRRPHGSSAPYSTKSRRRHVEKGTMEYVEKRARNNVAVRKSRAKAKEKQRETEGRVKGLMDQNHQLQKKVDMLTKELTVLKGLFLNVGASIPDDFLKLIGDS
uniref:CCAAT enhancer binding protein n=1 Tax=Lymnaea stagnalis TaxID=6523 RepID=Q76LX1_LYMST|nr:CCAAT enhancer binding protein [Lymnaea stagnalis]